jgi:hypothetical protein
MDEQQLQQLQQNWLRSCPLVVSTAPSGTPELGVLANMWRGEGVD